MPFWFWFGMVAAMVATVALDGRREVQERMANATSYSVSREDFNRLTKTFDTNKDGSVSKAEFVAAIEGLSDGIESEADTRQAAEKLFAEIDTGSTGSVPLDQMTKLFDLFDANGDGVITTRENSQKWQEVLSASS